MKRELFRQAGALLVRMMRWCSVACLGGLLFFVAAGVFVRFVPISSMGWADEVIEFAFAWMVFVGAAALWSERSHFRVDLIPERLAGRRSGRWLEIFLSISALAFLIVFTYEGGRLAIQASDRSPILEFPRTLWYLAIPLSGAIMTGYTIRDLFLLFRGKSFN